MDKIKDEFIKAIMLSLKIDSNPFISATIDEFVSHVKPTEYKSFMTALFGNQHQYLNGIDRVAKVAESFKPSGIKIDVDEIKAKELIELVRGMNESVYQTHIKTGVRFDDLINKVMFPSVDDETIAILNQVKPYCSHKLLISNINAYQTSVEQLGAFKQAIKQSETNPLVISGDVRKMISKR